MWILILFMVLHFVGDFVSQHRYLADNKGKDLRILALHCFIYAVVFGVMGSLPVILIMFVTTPPELVRAIK